MTTILSLGSRLLRCFGTLVLGIHCLEGSCNEASQVGENAPRGPASFCLVEPGAIIQTREEGNLAMHGNPAPANSLAEATVIDVMFLYTSLVLSAEGSEAGIHKRVQSSIDAVNLRLANSLINVRVKGVYTGLINYTESGSMRTDLPNLSGGVNGLQLVPGLRNDYKADFVCLITELESEGILGGAHAVPPSSGDQSRAFITIRRIALEADSRVLAHEIGHLLGCDHDREHSSLPLNSDFYKIRKPYIFRSSYADRGGDLC